MSDLPEGWVEVELPLIAEINPRHLRELEGTLAVSFVPMPAVSARSPDLVLNGDRKLEDVRTGYTHFAEGDVLFAKITPCMENGKGAVARGLTNGLGCGTTELHVVRPHVGVNAFYLYRFFSQQAFRKSAEQAFTGSAGQLRVPISFLKESIIPLPPLAEQRRIVEKVEALLAKVEACRERLERVPKLLARFRQSVLAAACVGRLTEDWRPHHQDSTPLSFGIRSDELPEEWRMTRVGSLLSEGRPGMKTGPFGSMLKKAEHQSSGIPVLGIENIGKLAFRAGSKIHITPAKAEELADY